MRFLTLAFDLFNSRPIVLHPLPSPGYRRRFFARVSTIYISSSPPRECIKIARVNTCFRGGFFRLYLLLQRGLLSTEINTRGFRRWNVRISTLRFAPTRPPSRSRTCGRFQRNSCASRYRCTGRAVGEKPIVTHSIKALSRMFQEGNPSLNGNVPVLVWLLTTYQ